MGFSNCCCDFEFGILNWLDSMMDSSMGAAVKNETGGLRRKLQLAVMIELVAGAMDTIFCCIYFILDVNAGGSGCRGVGGLLC
ncbi:hypothetical protein C5167_013182 [Papaver somniferum]|uniref:Uncharacterized protein n=1 Tax=Papaver somniferum TaxID=3469 RepID=A0A4Y7J2P7_PAPSO|nr:hypothetical protein C5167_013182 [Papaver somniferum]